MRVTVGNSGLCCCVCRVLINSLDCWFREKEKYATNLTSRILMCVSLSTHCPTNKQKKEKECLWLRILEFVVVQRCVRLVYLDGYKIHEVSRVSQGYRHPGTSSAVERYPSAAVFRCSVNGNRLRKRACSTVWILSPLGQFAGSAVPGLFVCLRVLDEITIQSMHLNFRRLQRYMQRVEKHWDLRCLQCLERFVDARREGRVSAEFSCRVFSHCSILIISSVV